MKYNGIEKEFKGKYKDNTTCTPVFPIGYANPELVSVIAGKTRIVPIFV